MTLSKMPLKFLVLLVALTALAACEDSISILAPNDNSVPQKTNFTTKGDAQSASSDTATDGPVSLNSADDATAALLQTADRMRQSGDYVTATLLYQRARGLNPDSMEALKGLATVAEARKQPREALQAYRDMLNIDENNTEALRGLGRNFIQLGLYDKAITQLNHLRENGGNDIETLNLLGMAYTRSNKFEDAIKTFEAALALDPDRLATQNNLGFAYIMSGDIHKAIAILEKLVASPHANAQQRQNLALAYGLAGRETDARNLSREDLPEADVEKNLRTYRAMRAHRLAQKKKTAKPESDD